MTGETYIMLRNDYITGSGYIWLHTLEKTDAYEAVEGLMMWVSTFGVVNTWVPNQFMESLIQEFRVRHNFKKA